MNDLWCVENLVFLQFSIDSMMTNSKACFSKHSQWPPKSFRLRQAWELVLLLSFLGCLRIYVSWFYGLCSII